MTSKLERSLSEMTDKNLKVDSIIDSMISGVVAVDNDYIGNADKFNCL
jgi:two-component system phosphate regulon sensor histidine kinase PhoR